MQYGDHRPYAAMSLLRAWRDRAEERASRRDGANPNEVIQDELFDWLDDNEYAGEAGNLPAVSLLFGELVEKGLFSYDQYIQRIIARGEMGLSFSEVRKLAAYCCLTTHICGIRNLVRGTVISCALFHCTRQTLR